jgi:hypothetical protein
METEQRQRNMLRQLFPEGEIYAVTDCEWLEVAAAYYGLTGLTLADSSKLPPEANVVLLLRHTLVSSDLRKQFPRAKVLVVPITSFDPALEAALYTQKLVMHTDYRSACALGRYWVDNIKNQAGPLVYTDDAEETGDGRERTELTCSFSDDLNAAAVLEPAIGPGQWISVGSFCELSLTIPASHDRPHQFSLDGTAVASGVLVARDRHCSDVGNTRIRAADKLRSELVAAAPISLRLDGGVLTEVRAAGQDFTDAVREVTNPEYGLQALELGIGTNQGVLPEVKWQINSQLNEGAGPVHLGFGEGITGAHMDFIVAASNHRFAVPV